MPPRPIPDDARIARVSATPINVPLALEIGGAVRETNLSAVLCTIETASGLVGHGFTAITEEEAVAPIIDRLIGPEIVGMDARATERIWDRLYWHLTPRGQTGYACHAIAAADVALWDLKGRLAGRPVSALLGDARPDVPLYTTFGFPFLDREGLVASARAALDGGFRRLKMTVAAAALARRDEPRPIMEVLREDARRVRAVRDAIGPEAELYIDANCSLDAYHAEALMRMIGPGVVDLFEEPLTQNDAPAMADLRTRIGTPVACGQNEGLAWRFRDLLTARAVDVIQPNVTITGGFTQVQKIAGMAAAFNVPVFNGGAWPFHNMHLHAGLANGGPVEWHLPAVALCRAVYRDLPAPENGRLAIPDRPGLGFEPDADAVRDFAARPSSGGRGKG